jgi:hypothetical protein
MKTGKEEEREIAGLLFLVQRMGAGYPFSMGREKN